MKKVIIYCLVILLVIVLGITVARRLMIFRTGGMTKQTDSQVIDDDKTKNEINDEPKNKEISSTEEPKEQEKPVEEPKDKSNSEDVSDNEKAIEIVKKDYEKDFGKSNDVYFSVEEKDETGNYSIFVRQSSTTKIVYRYKVNVNTTKILEKELEFN